MRCFVILTALFGTPENPSSSGKEVYVNRDLITIASPIRQYDGVKVDGSLLGVSGKGVVVVVQRPAEIFKLPCVGGKDTSTPSD